VTVAHFALFTGISGDVHPIHEDTQYAQERGFAAPVAHGLLVASLTALGGTSAAAELEASMLAFISCEYNFRRPIVVGDSVRTEFTAAEVRPEDATRGILALDLRVVDREGTTRAEGKQRYLILRGPSLPPR
jgi:acyl dehydratase